MKRSISVAALLLSAACSDGAMNSVGPLPDRSLRASLSATSTLLIDTGPGGSEIIGSRSMFAAGSSTCSPQPSCSASYQFLGAQFNLSENVRLESVEGWMYNNTGSIDVHVRADNSGLPGASLYSKNYSPASHFPFTWVVFDAFVADLGAGTYWLTFEPVSGGTFSGGMSGGAASPLPKYAFLSDGNPTWAQIGSNPFQGPELGIRIRGAVTTVDPAAMIAEVAGTLDGLGLPKGNLTSFNAKLKAAAAALDAGQTASACTSLQDLINAVKAQSGKKISASDASSVVAAVIEIMSAVGC